MKKSEIVVVLLGTIATFIFVGYMFDYYLRIEKVQVEKNKVYYDSVLYNEQELLKKKDSTLEKLIFYKYDSLNVKMRGHYIYHHSKLQKLMKEMDSIEKKK
jgi:hypothetical protein